MPGKTQKLSETVHLGDSCKTSRIHMERPGSAELCEATEDSDMEVVRISLSEDGELLVS